MFMKRIAIGINVTKSINITDELAKEMENGGKEGVERKGHSGIDIEEAKSLLKNEDHFDKQLYRQRIKKMHRVIYFVTKNGIKLVIGSFMGIFLLKKCFIVTFFVKKSSDQIYI